LAAVTFTTVIAVRDRRRPGGGEALGRAIAAAGHLPLTVLEVDEGDPRTIPAAATGHRIRLLVPSTAVGSAVIDHAEGRDGALIVIDALGGGPAGDELFDRDAEHILEHCPHPVLVLGPHANETWPATLIVPSDGAGLVPAAIPVVRSWIESIGAADVTVLALGAVDSWPATDDAPPLDDADEAMAALRADGIPASLVRSTVTEPDQAILAACAAHHGRAIVVVAAPPWSDAVTHWFSTSRRLIRHASCPVLVVPTEFDADDGRPN
jgi:nucleotide-binding universal stress UspA family protein